MSRATERLGRCGEYFTASVLSLESDSVVVLPHGSHADILFEHEDHIYKCQVKTKSKREKGHPNWRFDMRRGSHTKAREYKKGQVDIFALFSLEYMNVVFIPSMKQNSIRINDDDMRNKCSKESLYEALKLQGDE